MKFSFVVCIMMLLCNRTTGQTASLTWNLTKDTMITLNRDTTIKLVNNTNGDSLFVGFDTIVIDNISSNLIISDSSQSIFIVEYNKKRVIVESNENEIKIRYIKKNNQNTVIPSTLTIKLDYSGNAKKNQVIDQNYIKNKKILAGIDCRYGVIKNGDINYCKYLEGCNKIIVLDASPFVSGKSAIYRKDNDGGCKVSCCGGLKYCDYVKVYISNLNPYLYKISVKTFMQNIGTEPTANSAEPTSGEENNFQGSTTDNSLNTLNTLLLYSQAVYELNEFIDCVKNNRNPIEEVLDYNKKIIKAKLNDFKIFPGFNVDSLYEKLEESLQKKYKTDYNQARSYLSVYQEVMGLTYMVNTNLLPIQILSRDKLLLTITIRDTTGSIVSEQDYEYLISGGWKVDQSFGLVAHKLTDWEYPVSERMGFDTSYAVKSNGERIKILNSDGSIRDSISGLTQTVFKEILEGRGSSIGLGMSTLTHIYYRVYPRLNFGLGVGISADFYPTTNVRYLTGFSCIFKDDRNRIALNIGFASGKYRELSSEQKVGDILRGYNTTPNIIDKFGSTLFLGISYQNQIFAFDSTQKEKKEVGN